MAFRASYVAVTTLLIAFCSVVLLTPTSRNGELTRPALKKATSTLRGRNIFPNIGRVRIPAGHFKAGHGVLVEPHVRDPQAEAAEKRAIENTKNFFLNKGRLRDVLADDIPLMFERPPQLELFRDDVSVSLELGNLNLHTKLVGKKKYRDSFEYLRWARQIGLGKVEISVKMAPEIDPKMPKVSAKWEAHLYPRFSNAAEPVIMTFNSIYFLDNAGRVHKHLITDIDDGSDRIIPSFLKNLIDPFIATPPIAGAGNGGQWSYSAGEEKNSMSSTAAASAVVGNYVKRQAKAIIFNATKSSGSFMNSHRHQSLTSISLTPNAARKSMLNLREPNLRVAAGETFGGGPVSGAQDNDGRILNGESEKVVKGAPLANQLAEKAGKMGMEFVDFIDGIAPKTCTNAMECRRLNAFDDRIGPDCCNFLVVNMCCFSNDDGSGGGGLGQRIAPELQLIPIPVRQTPEDYGNSGGYRGRGGYGGGYGGYPPY